MVSTYDKKGHNRNLLGFNLYSFNLYADFIHRVIIR